MSKEHTLLFNRHELDWLYKRVSGERKHAERIMTEAQINPPTTETAKLQLERASQNMDMLNQQTAAIEAVFNVGMTNLGKITARREELEEQLSFVDEPHLKQKIEAELSSTPRQEEYRVTMSRHAIKHFLTVVKASIDRIKNVLIPEYEKRPQAQFETAETPMSRSFYINKLWRDKLMLEQIAIRLEKRL